VSDKRPPAVVGILILLVAAGLAVAACAQSPAPSPSPSVSSGVRGISLIAGGPGDTRRPEPGIRVAVYLGGFDGQLVARTKADAQGKFSVALEPGRYTLVQISEGAVPETVTVPPGEYVRVKLFIAAM
jgi:hypothetical protein